MLIGKAYSSIDPPAHVLSRLVVLHGGVYVPYLDAKKTSASHIIASNLTPRKRVMFKEYKVVRPEWLMDSIRDQKIKDWRLYREDQTPVREEDVGVAPSGTQIVQPRLAFQARPTSSVAAIAAVPGPSTPRKPPIHIKPTTPTSVKSPRRLPPPTSDPLTELHVQGMEASAAEDVQQPWPTGWYQTKPNERSAALLKDEAWRLQETAVNATEFLDKYYKESRLHWLSTWKAELKKMVGELSEGREVDLSKLKRKGPLKGTEEDERVVMHIDFDSFFVSASLLSRPHLKGHPVVVCHATAADAASSSEIASASYEAREFGIKNGMS
jgi:DNA repair protein REV1